MARCYPRPSANPYPFATYGDLGKLCRDLFSNGYNENEFKINVKNVSCHNVEVITNGSHSRDDDGAAKGEVSVKVPIPEVIPNVIGLGTLHKWNTDNLLTNEFSLQDTLYPGLRLSSAFILDGDLLNRTGEFKVQQKHKYFTLDGNFLGGDEEDMQVGGSLVTGYKGIMGAYKIKYDINTNDLKANNVGAAYYNKGYSFFLTYDQEIGKDGTEDKAVKGFFHHKVNRDIDVGCTAKISGEATKFAIAGNWKFDSYGHSVRAKVDNDSKLGMGIELKIMPGWQTAFSSLIDLKNVSEGNHKLGVQMNFGFDY